MENVCLEWLFVTFLPQTMDFAGEVPDGYLVCLTVINLVSKVWTGSGWYGGGEWPWWKGRGRMCGN